MKMKTIVMATAMIFGGWKCPGGAAEHPQEHPTASKEHPTPTKEQPTETKKEHPAETKKEHPAQTKKEHPKEHPEKTTQQNFQNNYEKVVKNYLSAESLKSGGVYTIQDDVAGKSWKLKLERVHKSRICMLQEGKTCFACADFNEVGGKNKFDLDFYANKSADGTMTIEKVLIHKMNGKPRFTYDKDNNMVPVK